MKRLFIFFPALIVLLISACTNEPHNIEAVMELLACEEQSKQSAFLINGSFTNCNETSNLFWFDRPSAKDEHIKLCALSKSNPLRKGKDWVQYQPKCFAFH